MDRQDYAGRKGIEDLYSHQAEVELAHAGESVVVVTLTAHLADAVSAGPDLVDDPGVVHGGDLGALCSVSRMDVRFSIHRCWSSRSGFVDVWKCGWSTSMEGISSA
jgi:hypothetical protein